MFAAPAAPGADAFFPGRVLLRMNAFICLGLSCMYHSPFQDWQVFALRILVETQPAARIGLVSLDLRVVLGLLMPNLGTNGTTSARQWRLFSQRRF